MVLISVKESSSSSPPSSASPLSPTTTPAASIAAEQGKPSPWLKGKSREQKASQLSLSCPFYSNSYQDLPPTISLSLQILIKAIRSLGDSNMWQVGIATNHNIW